MYPAGYPKVARPAVFTALLTHSHTATSNPCSSTIMKQHMKQLLRQCR